MPEPLFHKIGDQLTTALLSGRFDQYRALMFLPLRIVPRDGEAYVLQTESELKMDFVQYHNVIKAHGVTDIFRQLRRVEPVGAGQLVMVCTTHIMVQAQRIVDPFETRMHLIEVPDGWLIQEIESTEGHIRWTLGQAAILPDGRFDEGQHIQGNADDAKA